MKQFSRFCYGLQFDIAAFPFWCFIFTLFRVLFIFYYSVQLPSEATTPVLTALYLGLRLSLKTCGIILLLSVLCSTLPYVLSSHWPHYKLRLGLHSIALTFFSLCFVARFPYYKIFNQAFNQMLFNGIEDDKVAIVDTAIKEYGALYLLPLAIALAVIFTYIFKYYLATIKPVDLSSCQHKALAVVAVPVLLTALWVFCRYGGAFTYASSINWESAGRTKSNLLNEAILDDGQALYRTYALQRALRQTTDVSLSVEQLQERICLSGGKPNSYSLDQAFQRVVKQPLLAKQPRQVVLVLGESFGIWPLLPKFQELNLVPETASLQKSQNAYSIDLMLANGSGTITSLNGLITGLPSAGLYENKRPLSFKQKYTSGIAYIMKQLGYKTIFWYGGFGTWENLRNFALAQSFDEFHCADELIYTNGNAWGCPDAALFAAAKDTLAKEQDKVFCLILTNSNHPPYTLDVQAEGFPWKETVAKLPPDIANDQATLTELGHIWYADKTMGRFIQDRLKNEPSSLFIITGDHSERFSFAKDQDHLTRSAIPCIFYGQGITPQLFKTTEPSRGCHMQLAGTLAELLAPSGFTYTAYMPSMREQPLVWNHELYAAEKIASLKANPKLEQQANALRSLAAWRAIKGDQLTK